MGSRHCGDRWKFGSSLQDDIGVPRSNGSEKARDQFHFRSIGVRDGSHDTLRAWHDQSLDLRQLYTDIGGSGMPTLKTLGFFCDSDNTGSGSDGAFSNVVLSASPP